MALALRGGSSPQLSAGRAGPPRRRAHASALSRVFSIFQLPGSKSKAQQRTEAKDKLLELTKPLQRGALATDEDKVRVDRAAQAVERLNPNPKSISCPLLNGQWELLYTTSQSILAIKRPAWLRPSGPIFQILDNRGLRARNKETAPFYNEVSANLEPVEGSGSRVRVKFDEFKLFGRLPIKVPANSMGALNVTYVDEELRISRGNKGSLFVLRMVDRNALPDA